MIYPDRVDHYRMVTTFDSNGQETAAAPTTVETDVKAWIVRPGSGITPTAFGQIEIASDTILLHPYDSTGELRVVRSGDWFKDRVTEEVWNCAGPGDPIRLPSSFGSVKPRYSHIEVRVERANIEAAGVRPSDIMEP